MKRNISYLVVCLLLLATVVGAAPKAKPDLEVVNFRWTYGGSVYGDPNYHWAYLSGTVVNNSKNTYQFVLVYMSVIDSRTKEKIPTAPFAVVVNAAPGDKCQFQASPGVCVRWGKHPYSGRVDRIKGYLATDE